MMYINLPNETVSKLQDICSRLNLDADSVINFLVCYYYNLFIYLLEVKK